MLFYIQIFFIILFVLDGVALGLVGRRNDANDVFDDLAKFVTKHKFPFNFISFILILLVLPLSIPFSIAHLLKK